MTRRILLWHVHGSWTTAFVQGGHEYLLPLTPGRDPDGLGRARTWTWPDNAREVPSEQLSDAPVDLVVLQRPHEYDLAKQWLGRTPGDDVPAVYLEHNTPHGEVPDTRHPMAEQRSIPIVHVTHFNRLFWDNGSAPTEVIEHGILDPGHLYSGEIPHAGVVVNDPVRRGREVGADLVAQLAASTPVDLFGMRVSELAGALAGAGLPVAAHEDVPQQEMHRELARRRAYVHTARWTSLGLSLLEAMHLGMPVLALATTEAVLAVPPDAGVLTTSPEVLVAETARLVDDPEEARRMGDNARRAALDRYGLERFLTDWDRLIEAVCG